MSFGTPRSEFILCLLAYFQSALKHQGTMPPPPPASSLPSATELTTHAADLDLLPPLDLHQGCHRQAQSPLFGLLPSEIRSSIFAAALAQHVDEDGDVASGAPARRYPRDAYWYRPGFTGPRRSSSALLRTCRRACLEGQDMYWGGLEWAFWLGRSIFPFIVLIC